jgi:hypothetical protein
MDSNRNPMTKNMIAKATKMEESLFILRLKIRKIGHEMIA